MAEFKSNTQLLLIKIAEECSELSKEALKASQFGLDSVWHGKVRKETLLDEWKDLQSVMALLFGETVNEHFFYETRAKAEKINKYNGTSL